MRSVRVGKVSCPAHCDRAFACVLYAKDGRDLIRQCGKDGRTLAARHGELSSFPKRMTFEPRASHRGEASDPQFN